VPLGLTASAGALIPHPIIRTTVSARSLPWAPRRSATRRLRRRRAWRGAARGGAARQL